MFNPGRNNPAFLHMSDKQLIEHIRQLVAKRDNAAHAAQQELDLRLNRS